MRVEQLTKQLRKLSEIFLEHFHSGTGGTTEPRWQIKDKYGSIRNIRLKEEDLISGLTAEPDIDADEDF